MRRIKTDNLPVNFGMNTLAMFSDERGISMNDVFQMDYEKLSLMDLLSLLYAGLRDGARKAKQECKFGSLEEFCDYADQHTEIISEVADVFAEQQKEQKEEVKKK